MILFIDGDAFPNLLKPIVLRAIEKQKLDTIVIANKKIGAVPYLIENMKNGITYKSTREFVKKSEFIIDNIEKRKKIYENAYKTIIETWNVENATKNFIVLSEGLLNNKENIEIEKGPCSKA